MVEPESTLPSHISFVSPLAPNVFTFEVEASITEPP